MLAILILTVALAGCLVACGKENAGSGAANGGTPQGIYAGESFIRGSDGFVFIEDEGGAWYLVTYRGDRTIATLPASYDGNGYCIPDSRPCIRGKK